jgi:hypothetical protein
VRCPAFVYLVPRSLCTGESAGICRHVRVATAGPSAVKVQMLGNGNLSSDSQADAMLASVFDACFLDPKRSQKHYSTASSGRRISKMACHGCPHLQTGVVGRELSHPASAYNIQPLSYFLISLNIPLNNLRHCAFELAGTKTHCEVL